MRSNFVRPNLAQVMHLTIPNPTISVVTLLPYSSTLDYFEKDCHG
jgi:hypothetical protein